MNQLDRHDEQLQLGIDIGGTFTDFIAVDRASGAIYTWKSLTTPNDPTTGVLAGLRRMFDHAGLEPEAVDSTVHATTLITNTIIERTGARTGLITTAGFADLLEIRREVRYDLYDLFLTMPEPLVPEQLRLEVDERINAQGEIVQPLDEDGLRSAVRRLRDAEVEAVAVCFLHSYANDAHERRAAELIAAECSGLSVSTSSVVAREIREYERFSTTVANAYVQPRASRYLNRLQGALHEIGTDSPLRIMLSNGGITTVETAARLPVRLVESGPAAGALIAGHYGELAGESSVLAFDMGGTTAKLCLVEHGAPFLSYSLEVARVHRFRRGSGFPIRSPSVELIEIGAGGGSIARTDRLGLLEVGPESAGAEPGPACYGFGGEQATVTDADLLLGYLDPNAFLGGTMPLDSDAAMRAIEDGLATRLGLNSTEAAWGIHDLVNENMATAAGVYIAEHGRDPRTYTMIATGGAGPLHATGVARKIGLRRVLIPPAPGVASAGGLLVAPPRVDFAHSYLARLDEIVWGQVNAIYHDLESEGRRILRETGVPDDQVTVERRLDARYLNQGHEVAVSVPESHLDGDVQNALEERFETAYRRLFGRTIPGVPLEAVTWRTTVSGPKQITSVGNRNIGMEVASRPAATGEHHRDVYFAENGGFTATPVFRRQDLQPGVWMQGPAIIEETEATTVIEPEDVCEVDWHGNIVITLG